MSLTVIRDISISNLAQECLEINLSAAAGDRTMNRVIKDIEITRQEPITFVPISDVHIGHADFDEQYFKDTVAWIKKKGALTVLLGDLIDGIGKHDRRFENTSLDPKFYPYLDGLHQKQVEVFMELIEPIKDRVIAVMAGNHETAVKKQFSYDATDAIATALGVKILTDPGYVVLKFHEGRGICSVKIWCSHGCFLGGRYTGGKVNAMERLSQYFCADIYLAGHTHKKFVVEDHIVKLSKNFNLEEKRVYFANTGAFLRTYREKDTDSWASRNVFAPQVPGVCRFDFYLKTKNNTRYIDIHTRS